MKPCALKLSFKLSASFLSVESKQETCLLHPDYRQKNEMPTIITISELVVLRGFSCGTGILNEQ